MYAVLKLYLIALFVAAWIPSELRALIVYLLFRNNCCDTSDGGEERIWREEIRWILINRSDSCKDLL